MTNDTFFRLLRGETWALEEKTNALLEKIGSSILPASVVCFEPRLQGPLGHFIPLIEAYQRLFDEASASVNVFHHQDWQSDWAAGWYGVFPVVDHLVGAEKLVDEALLDAFTTMISNIVTDCATRSEARVALFPTARFLTLPGIARALAASKELRAAIIGVMETNPVPDCQDEALIRGAFRDAADVLRSAGKEVLLVAESSPVANDLISAGFGREQVVVTPYPAAARFDSCKPNNTASSVPLIGALGATRPVHNPGLLASYLLRPDVSDVRWRVKLDLAHAAAPLGLKPEQLKHQLLDRGVVLLPPQMSQEQYDVTLASLDVMLMPYGDRYRSIGSGIFLECLSAGVIPLVPAMSTMRGLYLQLGGKAPAIEEMSGMGVANAVEECVSDFERFEELKENAETICNTWLEHPYGPRNWRERVSRLLSTSL